MDEKKVDEEVEVKEVEKTEKKKETVEKSKTSAKKESKPRQRSIKYKKALELVDRSKKYSIDEAIELAKKTSYSKFDGSLEIHARLEKSKKTDNVRGLLQLPHGNGKTVKAVLLDDKIIESILKNKKTEYDVLVATPDMMPKIARIAKILGPQGKMPSPKSGTVTTDPDKILKEIQAGRSEYKADANGNIHISIGKLSWDDTKLLENYKVAINALAAQKLQSITLSATMGPGIKIEL